MTQSKFQSPMTNSYDKKQHILTGKCAFINPQSDKLIYRVTKLNEIIHKIHENKCNQTSQTIHSRKEYKNKEAG